MKKATALVTVLAVAIIVGLGTAAILQAAISYANMKIITIERIKAQYLAEAGMQYAISQCSSGDFGSPVTLNGEAAQIEINKTPVKNGWSGLYIITVKVKYEGI